MHSPVQNKQRVIRAIFSAVDEVNEQLPRERRLEKSIDIALFGKSGNLDSLGLVSFIIAVEQKIEQEFAVSLTLVNEQLMSQQHDPFQSIASLVDYVSKLLDDKSNGQTKD